MQALTYNKNYIYIQTAQMLSFHMIQLHLLTTKENNILHIMQFKNMKLFTERNRIAKKRLIKDIK